MYDNLLRGHLIRRPQPDAEQEPPASHFWCWQRVIGGVLLALCAAGLIAELTREFFLH